MQFKILFEDDSVLVLDKPSGIPSHTLDEAVLSCESELKRARPEATYFLAHRLDTGTSGALLFAKNESTYNALREQFKLKKIKKNYLAWSEITPERRALQSKLKLPLTLDWPLAHHAKSKKRMICIPPAKHRHFRGKPIPALSIVHQLREEDFCGVLCFCFDLEIVTGVMHQIRVHLGALGFPLCGDAIYEKTERETPVRLGLHARKIAFELNGFRYEVESKLGLAASH